MKAAPKTTVRAQTSSGRGVPPPRTGGRGGRGGRGAAPVVPKEEFNFAKMLQRFNKEKLAQSAEAKKLSTEVQAKPVYVKDDFFDTMSSEATDKASGKPRFHEQRRMDAMTFGFDAVSASHAASARRRLVGAAEASAPADAAAPAVEAVVRSVEAVATDTTRKEETQVVSS